MLESVFLMSCLIVFVAYLQSPTFKGRVGEWAMNLGLKLRLDEGAYTILRNVTLPTVSGTTQVDYVVVSKFGIFVIEVKSMKGWIFGSENNRMWTQTVRGYKYPFFNPLRQNYGHLKAIQAATGLPEGCLHSVVCFVGDAIFKTEMPRNVKRGGAAITYIQSLRQEMLTDEQVRNAILDISKTRLPETAKTDAAHKRSLKAKSELVKDALGGDGDAGEVVCPRCGGGMVRRQVRSGTNSGRSFLGCSNYPKCRHMIK